MADLSVTAANVRPGANAVTKKVTAGATVTAGQPVYKDTNDANEHKPCDANTVAEALCAGVALTNAGDGEELLIQTAGDIIIGAATLKGIIYRISATAGGITPSSDVQASGTVGNIVGVGKSTTEITIDLNNSGYLVA